MGMHPELQAHHIKDTPHRQGKRVVWFIRHPISRLASCHNYFGYTVGWPKETKITQDTTWKQFVDRVLAGEKNRHWDEQTPQVTYAQKFLPTEVYRFEDINEIFERVVGKQLPHMNTSNKHELDLTYRRDELDNFYIEDLEIWQRA
jgi:hypothetical protein